MIRAFTFICILSLLAGLSASAYAAGYQRIDLNLPGAVESFAYGINDSGYVVGTAVLSDGYWHAFVWQNGSTQYLAGIGLPNSAGFDINSNGQVVGYAYLATTYSDSTHPMLWHNESATDLGAPFGTTGGAMRINSVGQIAGYSYSFAQLLATLWQGTGITHLGTLGDHSIGQDVNAVGHVVGFSYFNDGSRRATLWRDGAMVNLGTLGGGNSQAQGVNASDWICGYSDTSAGVTRGFLWRDSAMVELASLGGTSSTGYDINSAGHVVGCSDASDGSSRATLWRSGTAIDLGTGGGVSSTARAISDKGWICGYSQSDTGAGQAVLWKPLPVLAITNKAAHDAIIASVMLKYQFRVWGKVTILSDSTFTLDDGSKKPVKVLAPGYSGIATGDFATATGMFTGSGADRVLNAVAPDVVKP